MGLRVVARDGARLTGAAVIARNAMREIEIFLPLSFLGQQTAEGTADTFLVLFALVWSGIFLFFPLFNRDRLRVGDLVAGTWVVRTAMPKLAEDLVGSGHRARRTFPKPRSAFTEFTSCRRSSRSCATSSPMRSRPSPGRSAKRPGCPTMATIMAFCRIITRRCASASKQGCSSAGGARASSDSERAADRATWPNWISQLRK